MSRYTPEQAARIADWEKRRASDPETITEAALCAWEHVLACKDPQELTRAEYMDMTSEDIALLNDLKAAREGAGATGLRWYCLKAAPLIESAYLYMEAYRPGAFCDAYDWKFCPDMFDLILDRSDFVADVFNCRARLVENWRELVEAWIDAEGLAERAPAPLEPIYWRWEEGFDKHGFGDGEGEILTDSVVEVLERAGYSAHVYRGGIHNEWIDELKDPSGVEIVDKPGNYGADPRAFLPADLVALLDAALPAHPSIREAR